MAAGDQPDAVLGGGQGVEHGQVTFAGHTEDVVHPVGDQSLDDDFGGVGHAAL